MIFATVSISIAYFEEKSNSEEKTQIPTIFLLICISWQKSTYIFLLIYIRENYSLYMLVKTYLYVFFFYQGFLSQTLTILMTAEEGSGPSFFPLYHVHSNISLQLCM